MITDFSKKYATVVANLKQKIRQAQVQAVLTINAQMLAIYWEIGKTIADQEKSEGWGTKVVETLAKDLKMEFPDMSGFSSRNLRYMRDFAIAYPDFAILQTPAAKLQNEQIQENLILQPLVAKLENKQIQENLILQAPLAKLENNRIQENLILQALLVKLSWSHHMILLDRVKDTNERQFYIQQTILNGWSRNVMVHQIEGGLYKRQGKIVSNFHQTIVPEESELIQQIFKDPYKFDFIYLGREAKERDLEDALTNQLTKFLLELGQWFAFMGRQYKMLLGEKEYFFDLLFYHTRLKRYMVIDLKMDEFEPEFKGKMEFYLNLADDQLKTTADEPSIGLILCKTKNGLVAEYALRDSSKPIGIAEYRLNESLPQDIKGELPSIEELESEMEKEYLEMKSPAHKKLDALKEKLANLKGNEIQQMATTPVLHQIFDKSLMPLFIMLINELREFEPFFFHKEYYWQGKTSVIRDINEVAGQWKDEDYLKMNQSFNFHYRLFGLKQGGVEGFDIILQLTYHTDAYWYGFSIMGYNQQQYFIKKLYHEQLTNEDKILICDAAIGYITDEIEQRLKYINVKPAK